MPQRIALSTLLAMALASCGGDSTAETETGAMDDTSTTAGAETPPPPEPMDDESAAVDPASDETLGEPSPTLTELVNRPEVDVYVNGPDRVGTEPIAPGTTEDFETEVRLVNTGEGALEVEQAVIRFEVWDADGNRTACVDADDTTPPSDVAETDAQLHRGLARCEFPEAGEYEVRTYVGFEGEDLDGDFDLERHYAGRTEVTVGG